MCPPALASKLASLLAASSVEVRDAEHEVRGRLRLGLLVSTSGGSALLPLVEAFERRYPACRVNVVDIPLTQGVEPLRRGDVELMRCACRSPSQTSRSYMCP
jgi:DNA-binding transcriptional LysR family regulator